MQERSSLQQRIDLLRSLGCSMDEIQENVEILKLSEQVILRRATMLKVLNLASATHICDLLQISNPPPPPHPEMSVNCQCKTIGCISRIASLTGVAKTCVCLRYSERQKGDDFFSFSPHGTNYLSLIHI